MMEVKPCSNRLLCLMDESATKSAGGLFLPEQAKKESQFGKVLAIGDGFNEKGEAVFYPAKPGNQVLVSRYGGVEVKLGDKLVKLFQCSDILAVIIETPDPVAEVKAPITEVPLDSDSK